MLDNKQLPLERATSRNPGQPLCMAQYYRLFSSCRIPGIKRDKQFISASTEQPSEHIIVTCRNHFYCLVLKAPDRGCLSEDEICSQLLYILNNAPCLPMPPPVGILTGWRRPKWAEARQKLLRNDRNRRNMELIEKALLVLCLDEALSNNFNSHVQRGAKGHVAGGRDETNLALQMLHGGGSSQNSSNRWFDKTIQIVISGDGACGLCYEHSPSEAVAIIAAMEKILKDTESQPINTEVPSACDHLPLPERLEWCLEIEDFQKIEEAAQYLDNLIKDLDFLVLRFDGYGKDFMKSCKVSPDAYVQLALQLAYYKLYGKLTATYESASTRRFLLGRVDCIRSASVEALEWASAMLQHTDDIDANNKKVTFHLVTHEEKIKLWLRAVERQTQEMVDNILGQGIDIHLLGLREAAKETSPTAAHPLPEIFTDESYRIANRFNLTTSQVATSIDSFMGYGPVEPDGYGASYNIKSSSIVFCLSSFWSSQITSTSKFAQALEDSLNTMQSLLGTNFDSHQSAT
ncbi:choline O-acetyltransferase [Agrilus planipennis]|nr:choline O-acetyltransferase [Agrilus planipennis]